MTKRSAMCGDATIYARALVTMARQQLPVIAMGSAGGSLSDRVRRLIGPEAANHAARSRARSSRALALVFTALAVHTIGGQTERTRFEVASIKPSPQDARGFGGVEFLPGGVVRGTSVPLFFLIATAYNVEARQLEGEFDLLNERFDVDAKANASALPPEGSTLSQTLLPLRPVLRDMLKALLAERFHLAMHTETRDSPIYALVVGASGHKLKPAAMDCAPRSVAETANGGSRCGRQGGGPASGLTFRDAELSRLAGGLTAFLDRPVLDRTGITGRFDIDLPPWSTGQPPRPQDPTSPEPLPDPDDPSIFALVQERLGLRLEPARAPLEVYIVDRVERPTPN